jgi:hypothetical protein
VQPTLPDACSFSHTFLAGFLGGSSHSLFHARFIVSSMEERGEGARQAATTAIPYIWANSPQCVPSWMSS